ncbi:MAG TPA: hypothetical protein VFB58_16750 [Chloroflexota bacterium]|nr:hypothetical protein [Chloroflexota bacterium]
MSTAIGLVHYPVVAAPRGDQPGVVYPDVRLAGTRAGHYDPAMPFIHEPCSGDDFL